MPSKSDIHTEVIAEIEAGCIYPDALFTYFEQVKNRRYNVCQKGYTSHTNDIAITLARHITISKCKNHEMSQILTQMLQDTRHRDRPTIATSMLVNAIASSSRCIELLPVLVENTTIYNRATQIADSILEHGYIFHTLDSIAELDVHLSQHWLNNPFDRWNELNMSYNQLYGMYHIVRISGVTKDQRAMHITQNFPGNSSIRNFAHFWESIHESVGIVSGYQKSFENKYAQETQQSSQEINYAS